MLSRTARPAVRTVSTRYVLFHGNGQHQCLKAQQLTDHRIVAPTVAVPLAAQAANYATLREIEDRLKSIRNIEKITKTMKIVASTKLTRAQRAMNESRQYGQTSNLVFENAETKPLESEDSKKQLYVVCSSDKGLCGGIHSGITRFLRRQFAEMGPKLDNVELVIIGEKCKAQLSRSNAKNIIASFAGIGKDVPTFADAQAIGMYTRAQRPSRLTLIALQPTRSVSFRRTLQASRSSTTNS